MKTYKKTIEEPRLKIYRDENNINPREWSNLGYFITVDSRHGSPDRHEQLENIVKNTGNIAKSQDEHIGLIKENYNSSEDEILAVYPVVKYEHSGIKYSLGTKHGFDYSNNGFYIITKRSQKEVGTDEGKFEKVIEQEIKDYNKWINEEILIFCLYDENGEIEDSCGGFYEIEDIREYLPDEWKDEDLRAYL